MILLKYGVQYDNGVEKGDIFAEEPGMGLRDSITHIELLKVMGSILLRSSTKKFLQHVLAIRELASLPQLDDPLCERLRICRELNCC